MRRPSSIDILNRLLVLHYRSLPMYLAYASPWSSQDSASSEAAIVLDRLVADQKAYAVKFADAILDRGGRIDSGGFPMEFTDLHMLSLDFLLQEVLKQQRLDIAQIELLAHELEHDPAAKELAEEALGNARGHLDSLEECLRNPATDERSTLSIHDAAL